MDSSRGTKDDPSVPIVPGNFTYSQVVQNAAPSGNRGRKGEDRLAEQTNQGSKTLRGTPLPEGTAEEAAVSRCSANRQEDGPVCSTDYARDDLDNRSEGVDGEQETAAVEEPEGNPAGKTEDAEENDSETQYDRTCDKNDPLTDEHVTEDDSVLEQCTPVNTTTCSEGQTNSVTDNTTPNTDTQSSKRTVDCQGTSTSSLVTQEKLTTKSKVKTSKSSVSSPLQTSIQNKPVTPKTRTRSQTITDSFKKMPTSKGTGDRDKEGAKNTKTKSSSE